MESKKPVHNVTIIGGGLVGSLCACFMAKRGHNVNLYEYRNDIRKTEHVRGRSINMAMSERARAALRSIGLEEYLLQEHAIPMRGRMIHNLNGSKHAIPYDTRTKQCIYSVGRRYLNEVLLTAAEKYDNVKLHFNHKFVNAHFKEGTVTLLQTDNTNKTLEVKSDLIVGADGAYSTVRRTIMKQPLFDFNQTYIEHGYMELSILPFNNEFAMEKNYLHIWPRGEFMMIALPNEDKSWTVTLFMPFSTFQSLNTSELLLNFFQKYFPDSISLIGEKRLIYDFFNSTPSTLISVKCSPYHVDGKAVIIGDAAHAMVPFYGQGMNAGFEDCTILDELLDLYYEDLNIALPEFSKKRIKDGHAICDLAMYNYIEMRELVNRKSFRLRKKLDDVLFWLLPNLWVPLYNSVSFTRMGYNACAMNRQWQDKVIYRVKNTGLTVFTVLSLYTMYVYNNELYDIFVPNGR